MKKNYSNKELKSEETKEAIEPPVESNKGRLICIRECVVPDFGSYISGDVIKDPKVIKRLGGNPNFTVMEG